MYLRHINIYIWDHDVSKDETNQIKRDALDIEPRLDINFFFNNDLQAIDTKVKHCFRENCYSTNESE